MTKPRTAISCGVTMIRLYRRWPQIAMVEVVNQADDRHDLAIDGGPRSAVLDPGETERLDLREVTSDHSGRCTIGDHDIAGMTLAIEAV